MKKITDGVAIGGLTTPAWWPSMGEISGWAVQMLPILSVAWLLLQMWGYIRRMRAAGTAAALREFGRDESGAVSRGGMIGGAVLAAVMALALPMIDRWEGNSLVAYRDIVGIPTICRGETRGVQIGDTATPAECDAMTERAVAEFERAIRPCLPDVMPTPTRAAFVVTAYNIGAGAFCKSSMSRRALAGDLRGACDALMMWTKAGGKTVRGLVNRRTDERRLCLSGLTQ